MEFGPGPGKRPPLNLAPQQPESAPFTESNAAKPTAQTEFVPAGESKKGISTFGLVLAALLLATLAYLTMTLVMGQQINFGQ
jgi:hypothetical protein